MKYKYIILGAGPAGLSFAHTLLKNGEESFLIIDQENEAGGLCRSMDVDGTELDIGGGHFLDVRNKDVLDLLFEFMPEEEWNKHNRISKIYLRGQEIDYPLESNLWQLPKESQADYLESIARTGSVRNDLMPEGFPEWIEWKLGDLIAKEYMIPYNQKIWSIPLEELGTYWLYKLPSVSFRETLLSCLYGKPYGTLPAHGVFFYPKKYGYGEVWRRMGDALGEHFIRNCKIKSIDLETMTVNNTWQAEKIVSSIPWPCWLDATELPDNISSAIKSFKNVSIDVDYYPENVDTQSQWIYEPDESKSYHRLLIRHNFCTDSKGYWTETNSARSAEEGTFRYHNEWAYPVNTINKPEQVDIINAWALDNKIQPLGRWGRWEHMNSDVAVTDGMKTAENMLSMS
jgi:protoporphyrinogen oxidase